MLAAGRIYVGIPPNQRNSIAVDAALQTATIGAGCRLGNMAERLFKDGLALPAGTCAPVGIAGIALGGGHGVSSRKFGLTTDNLLSVRMVDASGAELRASKTENTDLFWALQGGGGGNKCECSVGSKSSRSITARQKPRRETTLTDLN